jgi:hypothetical protein
MDNWDLYKLNACLMLAWWALPLIGLGLLVLIGAGRLLGGLLARLITLLDLVGSRFEHRGRN